MLAIPFRVLLVLGPSLLASFAASAAEPVTGAPVPLWNGRDLDGWTTVLREPVPSGAGLAAAGEGGVMRTTGRPVGYLATAESYSDFELTLEWRWPEKPGNSGVLLHLGPPTDDKVWPKCLQVQMKAGAAGELIPMEGFAIAELPPGAKAVGRTPEAHEVAPGEWNTCRIVCRGDTVECWLNGVLANRATRCSAGAGRIGLQLEGAPFELRGLSLRKLQASSVSGRERPWETLARHRRVRVSAT